MPRLLLACLLAAVATPAFASSFVGTTGGTTANGASNTSGSLSGDDKIVREARDDAALFVASEGRVRGARLESALRALREARRDAQAASDMELARAILAR